MSKTETNLNQYFVYEHLPEGEIRESSKVFSDIVQYMTNNIEDGAEKTAGMRKLLEAKDCFVRAKVTELRNRPKT